MNNTKILTYVLGVVALGMTYYLVNFIYSDIETKKNIAEVEQQVKEKLMIIREAEQAYQATNGKFTSDWDKLTSFINEGRLYIIQRKPEIIPLGYGVDSIIMHIDTLDAVNVKDSLFSAVKYPNLDISRLAYVPGSEKKFNIFADKIQKSGVTVDVIEVVDSDPVDKTRKEDDDRRNRRPLRFGSRTEITTTGNWE